jgi:hypothetical protein
VKTFKFTIPADEIRNGYCGCLAVAIAEDAGAALALLQQNAATRPGFDATWLPYADVIEFLPTTPGVVAWAML